MIYTLLAVDPDLPFSFDSFLGKVISDERVLSTKAEKNTTKRVGLACAWLHNDSIYVARSQ